LYNNNALLTWKTENEDNTQEFIVERSIDGRHFSNIGAMPASITSGTHQHTFTDKNVNLLGIAVVYYRLKQKDNDGNVTYSRIALLPVGKVSNQVICNPNPVISETNVTITVNQPGQVQARIVDNTGRVLQFQLWNLSAGSTSLPVDMSKLKKGIYYLHINGNSINKQMSLLKQ
jgi:hypothetical protein